MSPRRASLPIYWREGLQLTLTVLQGSGAPLQLIHATESALIESKRRRLRERRCEEQGSDLLLSHAHPHLSGN